MLRVDEFVKSLLKCPDTKLEKIFFRDKSSIYTIVRRSIDFSHRTKFYVIGNGIFGSENIGSLSASFHFYEKYFGKKVKHILTFDTIKVDTFDASLNEKDNVTLKVAIENVFETLSNVSPEELSREFEKYKNDPRTGAILRTLTGV